MSLQNNPPNKSLELADSNPLVKQEKFSQRLIDKVKHLNQEDNKYYYPHRSLKDQKGTKPLKNGSILLSQEESINILIQTGEKLKVYYSF